MMQLVLMLFDRNEMYGNFAMWAFLSIGAVSLFAVFIPVVTWIDKRAKEREAFYRAETFRRLAEASGDGVKATMEMMREEARQKQVKMIEGLKVGGLINLGVGLALVIFLRSLLGGGAGSPYLCGLIPAMVGVAMLVYVFTMARPVE
jgi:hypothetical protein